MRLILSITVILFSALAQAADKQPGSPCDLAKAAIVVASSIRGLPALKEVPCVVRQKEAVRANLMAMVKEKVPPQKLEYEGLAYKAIGFLPYEFDYEKGLIELYVSQLGGYYDPTKHYFVMAGWIPALFQTSIAVHELTHALQDQHFNLDKFVNPKLDNSDLLLARSALIEGDATAVMMDAMRKQLGQGPLQAEQDVNAIMLQNIVSGAASAGINGVPQSLQLSLLFPYTSGLRFVHGLLLQNGYRAVDGAFRRSPRSTEEILHMDKYAADEPDFTVFSDADLARADEGEIVHRDTMGEFVISALLGQISTDKQAAATAAAGWGGDRLVVLKTPQGKEVRWLVAWDTLKDAEEFLALYKKVQDELAKHWAVTVTQTERRVLIQVLPIA